MNVERFVNGFFFFVDVFFSKSSLNKNQLPRHGMSDGVLLNIYHIQTNEKIKETTSPKVEERVITTNGIIVV